jgi:hypothetical protein
VTNRPPGSREHRRAPELRLPYPLLEYLLELPGDYAKLTLRLLQRAQWVPVVTQTGVHLDAGEVLLSLRSRDLWGAVVLDRQVDEAGRVSLLRRVLSRLDLDGFAVKRAAHDSDTPEGARSGTRRDTPATVVRFLKYRSSLWPANAGATHGTAHDPTHGTTHQTDTIPSRDPATSAAQREAASDTTALASGNDGSPRIGEVRAVLAMAGSAFAEIVGAPYQHALPQALRADRRAAAELLAVGSSSARLAPHRDPGRPSPALGTYRTAGLRGPCVAQLASSNVPSRCPFHLPGVGGSRLSPPAATPTGALHAVVRAALLDCGWWRARAPRRG